MSAPVRGPFDPDQNPEARDSSQEGPWRPGDGNETENRAEIDPNQTEESPPPDRAKNDDDRGNDGGTSTSSGA